MQSVRLFRLNGSRSLGRWRRIPKIRCGIRPFGGETVFLFFPKAETAAFLSGRTGGGCRAIDGKRRMRRIPARIEIPKLLYKLVMKELRSGELYVFTGGDGDEGPIYGVVDEVMPGSVRLDISVTERKVVRDTVLPPAYRSARLPSAQECEGFYRAIDYLQCQEKRIAKCLQNEPGWCGCEVRLKMISLVGRPELVEQ